MTPANRDAQALTVRDLFLDTEDKYEIPPYQRNYTWGEEEISQLIRDIHDQRVTKSDSSYHLGNLVVAQKPKQSPDDTGNTYEVIDGQQRLTTLFILLAHLRAAEFAGVDSDLSALGYESRPAATRVLTRLRTGDTELNVNPDDDTAQVDEGIVRAARIIKQLISAGTEDTGRTVIRGGETLELGDATARYLLNNVKIIRMEIPRSTNLNRYFEVMNTRGVQLSPVDIVKARLMRPLNADDHTLFDDIWTACFDMTRYVQMTFAKGDTNKRAVAFGDNWSELTSNTFDDLQRRLDGQPGTAATHDQDPDAPVNLETAMNAYATDEPQGETEEHEGEERFTSQVSFEVFLLHVLTVTTTEEGGDRQLDDKKLVERFTAVLDKQADQRAWVTQFAWDLLHCRLLFDRVIIKRDANLRPGSESTSDPESGDWSLSTLSKSTTGNRNSAVYSSSFGAESSHNGTLTVQARLILLQSALRTTYTSPRTMHWITEVLRFVRDHSDTRDTPVTSDVTGAQLLEFLENQTRKRVRQAMHSGADGGFPSGFAIPRIVFTYLDYLLVLDGPPTDFRFVYRTSIEHFSPQNRDPEKDWTNYKFRDPALLHSFGNLALVSVQVNSKFSNGTPQDKAGYSELRKQSPKLEMMCEAVKGRWTDDEVREHDKTMRCILECDLKLLPPDAE